MNDRSGLTSELAEVCREASGRLPGPVASRLDRLVGRLGEPLSLAVVGRVDAGKSTLVNALIGRQVAPTDASECTKAITWFRFGPEDRAQVRLRSGATARIELDADGLLPEKLGFEAEEVAAVEVWLSIEPLRETTLIDTPGLNSLNTDNSDRTLSLVAGAEAEALLFVLNTQAHDDEQEVMRTFRQASAGFAAAPTCALGVLSRADQVTRRGDPWPVARELAEAHSGRLSSELGRVLPLVGLLAETVETGQFNETDARQLRALAALDDDQRQVLLLSADLFVRSDSPVGGTERERLLGRLGLYGLRHLLAGGAALRSAPAMVEDLRERSGIVELKRQLNLRFTQRRPALKAARVLAELESAANAPDVDNDTQDWLWEEIERINLHPAMHALDELRALGHLTSETAGLTADQLDEAMALLEATDPRSRMAVLGTDTDAGRLLEGVRRWTTIANTSTNPRRREVARVVARALHLSHQDLQGGQW